MTRNEHLLDKPDWTEYDYHEPSSDGCCIKRQVWHTPRPTEHSPEFWVECRLEGIITEREYETLLASEEAFN